MQEKFPLQCLFLIRVCSRDYVVFRTENIRSKKDAKKAELHRHAGPLYLKDLNGCNGDEVKRAGMALQYPLLAAFVVQSVFLLSTE